MRWAGGRPRVPAASHPDAIPEVTFYTNVVFQGWQKRPRGLLYRALHGPRPWHLAGESCAPGGHREKGTLLKRLIVAAIAATFAVLVALPVYAIRYGDPDNGEHPYVGLMVATTEDGAPLWRCSGTLISPTVFLTAGHCTEAPAARATIWFHEDVDADAEDYPLPGSDTVTGTTHTHPDYNPDAFYLFDAGIVVLDDPVVMNEYGALPDQGAVDALFGGKGKKNKQITAVGYGLQSVVPGPSADRVRLKADLNIVSISGTGGIPAGTSMFVSGDAAKGGTCFGDSGGPQFQKGTNIVLAVTSFGLNANCTGVGGGYRIDQADDLEWIGSFLD